MPTRRFYVGAVVCIAASLLSAVALANDFVAVATPLAVPDSANNRVLIYNSPSMSGAADVVLGQGAFTTAAAGTSSTTMSSPVATTYDFNGNLYVSDSGNCRVLVFHPPFVTGEAASIVIGQNDANTGCGAAASASTLGTTGGVVLGSRTNLWVADKQNNRVLKFLMPFKTGMAAKLVVGQPDFVSNACPAPPTASSLCAPTGVAFDDIGDLWVADTSNNRLLAYRAPKNSTADAEFGHPAATAYTSSTPNDGGVSASSLDGPSGIGFDSSGVLWVADTQNSRVLSFKRTFHHNGEAASVVLGQPNFTSPAINEGGSPSASSFFYPQGIITIGADVWVGDTQNSRTLQFTSPITSGMNASLVLGQPDFNQTAQNQGGTAPTEQTQNTPFNLAGPSLIALAVLGGLAAGRQWIVRLQKSS